MGRIGLAFRLFFRVLFDAALAERTRPLLAADAQPAAGAAPRPAEPPPKKKIGRSDALNLLAMLQREARLVDFLQESIAGYEDAQIGAAVRDVHRDAAMVLKRVFALQPVRDEAEGSTVEVPADFDAARLRFTGKVADRPPFRGTLAHHGWLATQCVLPEWTGDEPAALVVAPAVVELT
ncbi:MAG TPA: DUF2760 domain-containing protein [Pirellulales bacterium]|nr:DUF2760 domain-containing protein [Pirellulales bacterium]